MLRFWPLSFRRAGAVPATLTQAALAPLAQARRCLDLWLREEGRRMPARQRQRAAALIARYFANEDAASDALILSFLRHYSGFGAVDLDDPLAVRQELKTTLDRSTASAAHSRRLLWLSSASGLVFVAAVLAVLWLSQQTLTLAEQQSLRRAVAARAVVAGVAPATVWSAIKRELDVNRYQDIRRWDHDAAMRLAAEYKPR